LRNLIFLFVQPPFNICTRNSFDAVPYVVERSNFPEIESSDVVFCLLLLLVVSISNIANCYRLILLIVTR
jgi:hypothetical protein